VKFAILAALLLTGPAQAEVKIKDLISKLSAEDRIERDQATAALVQKGVADYPQILPAIARTHQKNPDPEARARALSVLRLLYKIEELNENPAVFGFVLGWYLDHDGSSLKSFPLVTFVVPKSPAEAAGFKPGDVIVACDGKDYHSIQSRNDLVRDLGARPVGTEVSLRVVLGEDADPSSSAPKKIEELRLLKSVPRSDFAPVSRFNETKFRVWVKALVKTN